MFFLVFHQGGGRARVYLCTGCPDSIASRAGPEPSSSSPACNVSRYPWSEQVMAATPAGPCATYPGDDTWTDAPFADGVVLIGDAAGHNDPIIGARALDCVARRTQVATSYSTAPGRRPDSRPTARSGPHA